MTSWLGAFLFTQLVEVPIYTWALRGRPLIAFAASAITHPFVWWVFPRLTTALELRYRTGFVLAETFAVVVEAIFLHRMGLRHAWLWSLGANATSVALGLTSRAYFGWP